MDNSERAPQAIPVTEAAIRASERRQQRNALPKGDARRFHLRGPAKRLAEGAAILGLSLGLATPFALNSGSRDPHYDHKPPLESPKPNFAQPAIDVIQPGIDYVNGIITHPQQQQEQQAEQTEAARRTFDTQRGVKFETNAQIMENQTQKPQENYQRDPEEVR